MATEQKVLNLHRSNQLDDEQTIEKLDRLIKDPPDNSRIFTITPKIAEYILEHYDGGNRPRKPEYIARYARDIKAGKWFLTGDTIKFSEKQLLRDGRNRLQGCISAGIPFRTHVVFGIPDKAFLYMDRGKVRTVSDALFVDGVEKYTNLTAGAVRWVELIRTDKVKTRESFEPEKIVTIYRRLRKDVMEWAVEGARRVYIETGRVHSPTLLGGLFYLFAEANHDHAKALVAAWAGGKYGDRFVAFSQLNKKVAEVRGFSSGRIHDVVLAAMTINAWNKSLTGKRGRADDLSWTLDRRFPEIKGAR